MIQDIPFGMYQGIDLNKTFGMPPKYIPFYDQNNRIYESLWGKTFYDGAGVIEENAGFMGTKIRVGSPQRIPVGVFSAVMNAKDAYNNADGLIQGVNEATQKATRTYTNSINSGFLNSYKFGPCGNGETGKNKYLEVVDHIIESMGYGMLQSGFDNEKQNPFYIENFRTLHKPDERYPEIFLAASDETNITESASSSTGESFIANTINQKLDGQTRDIARNLNFFHGGGGKHVEAIKGMLNELTGNVNFFGYSAGDAIDGAVRLASNVVGQDIVNAFIHGNQLFLPDVWQSSSFSKSYSISLRLSSPYGDRFSIAKNILIPLAYILGFTLPCQVTPVGLSFPFLIQVDRPGAFSINAGIVTNISIKKGGRDDIWSSSGLPRSVDVNIDVTDLYQAIPAPTTTSLAIYNEQSRNYFANLAGGHIDPEDSSRYETIRRSRELFNRQALLEVDEFQLREFVDKYGLADVSADLGRLGSLLGNNKLGKLSDQASMGNELLNGVKGAVSNAQVGKYLSF